VDGDWPTAYFEKQRPHLRAVAYRMLGSVTEAEDAVQETWLRLSRAGDDVRDLRAWLTTVVSRVCLDMLRARTARREDPLDVHVPDPLVVSPVTANPAEGDPAEHAVLADSVSLALLVVLDTLPPAERLAFVLHDVFAVPFEQIGGILDRSPAAAKQLASRARQRLRDTGSTATGTAGSLARQWEVVDAFFAAANDGDFDALLAVLDPDVVLRADAGAGPLGPSQLIRGARDVIAQAERFTPLGRFAHRVLVNGGPGAIIVTEGKPLALASITIVDGKIIELDFLADPDRLARLDLTAVISGP
jgi:RNA polymerase sigma factor (sigma-70 family)